MILYIGGVRSAVPVRHHAGKPRCGRALAAIPARLAADVAAGRGLAAELVALLRRGTLPSRGSVSRLPGRTRKRWERPFLADILWPFELASIVLLVAIVGSRLDGTTTRNQEEKPRVIQSVPPVHYLIVSALLLVIGTFGVLVRRNHGGHPDVDRADLERGQHQPGRLLSSHGHTDGQAFALMVMTVAIAEAAVGLGVLIALFRNRGTVLADELELLKW